VPLVSVCVCVYLPYNLRLSVSSPSVTCTLNLAACNVLKKEERKLVKKRESQSLSSRMSHEVLLVPTTSPRLPNLASNPCSYIPKDIAPFQAMA
jgi:hypothetical protein